MSTTQLEIFKDVPDENAEVRKEVMASKPSLGELSNYLLKYFPGSANKTKLLLRSWCAEIILPRRVKDYRSMLSNT